MTTELAHSLDHDKQRRKRRAPGGAMIFAVRLVLFWEWLWPAILPAVAILYAIAVIRHNQSFTTNCIPAFQMTSG
ncbi:MAG: hypothetical protein JKX88_08990 [Marinicaulis sp.]|nr:hypothetical protein [Marinicaulis sp.]